MEFKRLFLLLLIASSLFFTQCTSYRLLGKKSDRLQQFREQVQFLLSDPTLSNAHIGVYIESLRDGAVIYSQNPFKIMIPASNMKLFTTATALVKLGPDFRFKTPVFYSGTVKDSALDGNLVIKGSGDPTISGRFFNGDRLAIFKSWADSLLKMGIKKINGDLIGDESLFKDPKLADGWEWDDEPYWYAAQISALAFNDNCVDVAVFPDSVPGAPVRYRLFPQNDSVEIINNAVVVDSAQERDLTVFRLRGQNTIVIKGNLPVSADTLWESITVEEPGEYFLNTLRNVLQQKGIEISGSVRLVKDQTSVDYAKMKLLFFYLSPPISEIIKVVNKPSHNFYAEQLLKTLGALFKNEGSFTAGSSVVREFMQSIGIAPEYFINVDGSGLSRKNFIAPIATAVLVKYMYRHKYFSYYYDSLPIAGVDGTLKNRMKGTTAEGNVHAKTGYVRHTRALSGYANIEQGEPVIFVMMFNNYSVPTPTINGIQDHICNLISGLRIQF